MLETTQAVTTNTDEQPIPLTDNARVVLMKRYVRRGPDGKPIESVEGMFRRVARAVAEPDRDHGADVEATEQSFYRLLTELRFFPNSPTFTGAGTPLGQLAACFVIPISDDMGRDSAGIFQTLRDAALIQQTGGGNGFSFGRLRPKGTYVTSSAGQATGPVGFLRVYDKAFGEIAQGGCLLPETLVFTSKGLLRLDELADIQQTGWQDHHLEVATDEGWRASPRAYNNGVAPILRVHTRQGLSLAGTPEHRVKVMTDQGPQWRRLNELRVGDWLLVQLGQQRGQLQALRQPQHGHGNQVWPKLPAILDEELAFLIGYLIGDGFVAAAADDHRVGVSVAHRSYLMTEMPALLERLFGVTLHRQQKANDRSVTLVIDNRAVKEFLQINGLSKSRSRTASVPRLIRQSPPEVIGAFLRGLFEADGSLSHGYPNLTTTSPRLAEEVSTLLIGLGCPVRIRSVIPGVSHYGKVAIYHIRIESTVGLQAWREQIGCDARSRFATCLAWESDTRRESTYVLPHPRYWLQPVLEAITLEQIDARGRGMGVNFRSSQPRLRRTLLRYLCGDRQFTRSAFDDLSQAYPEFAAHAISPQDKWFVQVIGVESEGEALTLDLEVDDNHTYLAYGLVTHNTRRGANMAVLPVHHPDIIDFINCKVSEDQITNFNISVGITDKFMAAVRDDKDFELIAPQNGKVQKTVRAREVFNAIVKNAYRNGEPGVLFLDAANRSNPVPHLYDLEATNPCHRGDNLVHTSLGVVPIRDLVGRQFNVVLPSGEVAEATAFPTGIKPLYRVYLDNGMIIDLTENHNLIQEDGRKVRVKELKPGTRLQLATEAIEPISPKYQFSEEEGMLLGWNAGDGWITFHANQKVQAWQVGFVFGQQDEAIAQWTAQRMAEQIGIGAPGLKPRPERGVWELATTNKDFTRYFLDDLGAVNKRQGVPESVLRGNREFQRGYLRGLFSADGYVSVKGAGKKERRQLGLVTAHEQLARKVQILLSTFGIVSRLRHSQNTLPGRDKTYERWQVTLNADQFVKFLDLIGFMPGSAKQGVAEAMLQRHWRETHSDTCGTVVKVEPLNIMEPVFNLTVNHLLHQFAVNGMISANCGEQWLGPYENCCLGSINLAQHVKHVDGEAQVDWPKLQESIVLSTHFLDNVVTANKYVPAVPQLKEAAHRARRIGLGIMGLGDLMYHLGIRYGSEEAQEFASQVMEFVRYHCMKTSVQLAKDRGAFPAIEGSLYDPKNLKWTPPQALVTYQHNWGRPTIDWNEIVRGIKKYGIRNAAQATVAPTGTIATVAGCEAYGCEPVFALAYLRHVVDADAGGKDGRTTLTYASPLFEQALIKANVDEATRQRIYDEVMSHGTCQNIKEVPEAVRRAFVVSADITPEEHVRMQAMIQAFVDNSISKTCNFPENAKEEDVAQAYFLAWELGCKGLTVYVTGSREKVVLETKATAQKKEEKKEETRSTVPAPEPAHMQVSKKPRPRKLRGETFRIGTPLGTAFITININGGDQPFEVFLNVGKAGSDTAAVAEALGRLISLVLRLPSAMSPIERMKMVVDQLAGIGGGRSLGFGPNRVRSLPDGISQALAEYLSSVDPAKFGNGNGHSPNGQHAGVEATTPALPDPAALKIGDLCPECGEASYVNEEGCRKCYSCGHSEC